jgi:uncharacterized protein YqeY
MSLKEKIQQDFIAAMKARNEVAKSALSGIKAKITEAEKANGNQPIGDDEVVKVIIKAVKQRKESADAYTSASRHDLAIKELAESDVISKYLPAQMTPQEISDALVEIMQGFSGVITNPNALQGKTIGEFNKRFSGRAEIGTVKEILSKLVKA